MGRMTLDDKGQWIERSTKGNKHGGHGRRRRWGYTKDSERIIRPCMVNRQRPPKGKKRSG